MMIGKLVETKGGYREFKKDIKYESYLSEHKNEKKRHNYTRFRVSAHRLNIEVGRYCKPPIPAEKRLCTMCETDSVENEYHLFSCTKYEDIRIMYGINVSCTNQFYECMEKSECVTIDYIHECFKRRFNLD